MIETAEEALSEALAAVKMFDEKGGLIPWEDMANDILNKMTRNGFAVVRLTPRELRRWRWYFEERG